MLGDQRRISLRRRMGEDRCQVVLEALLIRRLALRFSG
jgi:hypothetical protein